MRISWLGTGTGVQNRNGRRLAGMAGAGDISLPEASSSGTEEEGEGCRKKVCFIHSQALLESSDMNPRYTGRAELVYSLIEAYGLLDHMRVVAPEKATRKQLQGFHSQEYIHFLETHSNQSDSEDDEETAEEMGLGYDCPLFTGCYDYACYVGGAGLTSADLLLRGEADIVVNWYGGWHHAKRDSASGYCYCNDIVLAILRLQSRFSRILYVDIDIHHGDGVEEAFWHSPKVMTVSFHHFSLGFFPGSGAVGDVGGGRGKFHTVNVPLHEGVQDAQYLTLFSGVMAEVRARYQPQCLLLQCGADLLTGDPLGEFNLTPRGAGRCVEVLLQWRLPTVMMGGGGYSSPNTARFWSLCTGLALSQHLPDDIPDHELFPMYAPDYQLHIPASRRATKNSPDYVSHLMHRISDCLSQL